MSLIPASANRTPSTRRRRRRSAGTVSAGLERLEPRQMLAVDINGDGLTDLLWQNDGGGVIAWIRDGSGRNTTATRFVGGDSQWRLTALGDFDGDGVTDVIWRQQATGVCVLWLMRGDGYGIWGSRVLGGDQQWQIEATGDYNGDGRTDLIWRHAPTGINVMWLMDGTNNGEAKAIGGDLTWRLVVHNPDYDANGDGRTDLIWRQSSTGAHVFWNMNGFTVESARENGRSLDWTLVGVGTKGPGRNDLLWRHDRSGVTVRWVDSWAASFEVLLASPEWTVAGTPDLDHDGIYDIAWQHVTGGTLAWVGNGRAAVPLGGAWQWSVVQPTRHDSGAFPAPPVALTPTAGNGQVALQWSRVPGSTVSEYEVEWSTSESFSNILGRATTTATAFTVTGLANGTPYHFRVKSWYRVPVTGGPAGRGSTSDPVVATPFALVALPGRPGVPTTSAGNGLVTLQWSPPAGSDVSSYEIQWSTNSSFSWPASVAFTSGTSYTVTNLVNGTQYFFRVAAVNSAGTGSYSDSTTAIPFVMVAVPGQPGTPTATAGNGQVSLQWTPPAGSTVSSYQIQWSTSSSFGSPSTVSTGGTSYTVSNLANGTQYFFRVAASNSTGTGSYSGMVAATPSAPPAVPAVPSAPLDLSASPGDEEVRIQWSAPLSTGGSPITGYVVEMSTSPSFASSQSWETTTRSGRFSNLSNGVTYYFRVRAKNSAGGIGNPSNVVSATPRRIDNPTQDWWTGTWDAFPSGGQWTNTPGVVDSGSTDIGGVIGSGRRYHIQGSSVTVYRARRPNEGNQSGFYNPLGGLVAIGSGTASITSVNGTPAVRMTMTDVNDAGQTISVTITLIREDYTAQSGWQFSSLKGQATASDGNPYRITVVKNVSQGGNYYYDYRLNRAVLT